MRSGTTVMDAEEFCTAVGLTWADPEEPGIVRCRWGRGFTFRWPDGTVVRGPHRDRCEALVIPPAWTDVWVCPVAGGHLQAVGTDDAGRRQYRYHDLWSEARTAEKFDRLVEVGERMSRVRRAIQHDLVSSDSRRRALAAMVGLLDRTLGRIGNPESVEQFGTHGISTLGPEHVETDRSSVRLQFRGKGGTEHDDVVVVDRELAAAISELEAAGDDWLFAIDGTVLDATDANDYLASHSGGTVGCKDIRTWGGSAAALAERIDDPSAPRIADAAADALGNTRAVARASYVHPVVFDACDDDVDEAWRASRSSRWYEREERALLKLLRAAPPLLDAYLRRD